MILVTNMTGGIGGSSSSSNKGTLEIHLPKTNYLFGETFSLTNVTITYIPKRGNPVDVTNQVIAANAITPNDNYVWDVSGQQTVRAIYTTPDGYDIYGTAIVTVSEEGKGYLTVTSSKMKYKHGDQFNTSVLTIVYTDALGNNTTIDPGSVYVTTDPANGDTFQIDGTNTITVTYDKASETGSQTAVNPAPAYLKVEVEPAMMSATLKLKQIAALVKQVTNYNGAELTINYTDGTRKVITYGEDPVEDAKIIWDPHEAVSLDEAGDVTVTATYTENGVSISASSYIKVSNATLKSITFTMNKKSFKAGDSIDYTSHGAKVIAKYSDNSTRDVTAYTNFSPNGGSWRVEDTTVTATYTENNVTVNATVSVSVADAPDTLTVQIAKTNYTVGDSLDYSGSQCIVRYISGKEVTVDAGSVSWSPASGTQCTSEGSIFITASYQGLTGRTSVSVSAKTTSVTGKDGKTYEEKTTDMNDTEHGTTRTLAPSSIKIISDPVQTTYDSGETIDYTGISVGLLDKDGEKFTNSDYPDGKIPFRELDFPVKTAQITDSTAIDASAAYANVAGNTGNGNYITINGETRVFTAKRRASTDPYDYTGAEADVSYEISDGTGASLQGRFAAFLAENDVNQTGKKYTYAIVVPSPTQPTIIKNSTNQSVVLADNTSVSSSKYVINGISYYIRTETVMYSYQKKPSGETDILPMTDLACDYNIVSSTGSSYLTPEKLVFYTYGDGGLKPGEYVPEGTVKFTVPVNWTKYSKTYSDDLTLYVRIGSENSFTFTTGVYSTYQDKLAQLQADSTVTIFSNGETVDSSGNKVYQIRYMRTTTS